MPTYKDANGSLTLERRENIVFATFSGAINPHIMACFIEGIDELIEPIKGQPWAYVSDSTQVQAATPDSEEGLFQAVIKYASLGCIAGAYVSGSVVMINQMDKVLKRAGVVDGISGKLFSSVADAKMYCESTLNHTQIDS